MISILAILLMGSLGALCMHRLLPGPNRVAPLLLKGSLGIGMGVGLGSCTLFLTGLAFDGLSRPALFSELGILSVALALTIRHTSSRRWEVLEPCEETSNRKLLVILALCCLVIAAIDLWQFMVLSSIKPDGSWDAYAIWNVRARFLFRLQHEWTNSFHTPRGHPDYPLLIPLSIARFWAYLQHDTKEIPRIVSLAFGIGSVATLVSLLSVLRGWTQGLLAGLVLLGTYSFIEHATWQNADVPLGFYILGACGLLSLHARSSGGEPGLLIPTGIMLGLGAWTKNEGAIFALLVVLSYCAYSIRTSGWAASRKPLSYLALGVLPVMIVLFTFKLGYAPANDLIKGQSFDRSLDRISDWSRYVAVTKAFRLRIEDLMRSYLWILPIYVLLAGTRLRKNLKSGSRIALAALILTYVAYFFAYILTPKDLQWHLRTSCERLLLQLWPSTIFLFFLSAATPEEAVRSKWGLLGTMTRVRNRCE